jgi:FkbM family methyltransferase
VTLRVPILRGPLRGWWWSPASGGKLLRVLGGTYEAAQTAHFRRWVRPGSVVFDLGAHTGYYTLLSAALTGRRGRVVAFEPSPRNLRVLRRHLHLNGLRNVEVVEAAAAAAEGTAEFALGTGSGTGRLAGEGTLRVATTTVDLAAERLGLRPSVLKIDVEGAELDLLSGSIATLESARPVLFLSTHGAEAHRGCLELLGSLGYESEPIDHADLATASEVLCVPRRA